MSLVVGIGEDERAMLIAAEPRTFAVAPAVDEGRYDVFATGADPVQFPVHGFREHTVDVVVRPSSSTVIVSLLPVSGIDLLQVRRISYSTFG